MSDTNGSWLAYDAAAAGLGLSLEGARAKARRLAWPRRTTNSGKVEILVPDELLQPADTPARPGRPVTTRLPPGREKELEGTITALGRELSTTRTSLAVAEAVIAAKAEEIQRQHELVTTITGEVGALTQKLQAAAADLAAARAQAQVEQDRARERLEEATSTLKRLEADLAAERARPWWRRLLGT
jgi:hypothetical protein